MGGGQAGTATGPADWGPPPAGTQVGPPPASAPARMSKGQMALVAGAVLAVVGLFAFMMANGGRDTERERELARINAEHDARDEKALAAGPTASADPDVPKDVARFCKAALDIKQFSNDLVDAIDAQDFERTKQTMIAGVDDWQSNVDEMQATLPASFATRGMTYERSYRTFYETWMGSEGVDDVRPKVLALDMEPGSAAWHDLQTLIFDTCL